jgi:hypothetical protein
MNLEDQAELEQERAERRRLRDEALAELTYQRWLDRDSRWQASVAYAADMADARRAELQARIEAKEQRSAEVLAVRGRARALHGRRLQEHFQRVRDTAEWAKQDDDARSRYTEEHMEMMFQRSQEHLESRQLERDLLAQQQHERQRDREHEVLRVARAQEYGRQQAAATLQNRLQAVGARPSSAPRLRRSFGRGGAAPGAYYGAASSIFA